MSFREYSSSSRTVDLVIPSNEDGEIFTLRHLREIVAATTEYHEESFVTVANPKWCEDDRSRYWIDGIAVKEITGQNARGDLTGLLAEPEPDDAPPEPVAIKIPIDEIETEPPEPPTGRDSNTRRCEICGRVGTRRFVHTETGWKCSPTATACPGNRVFPPPPAPPEPAVDLDIKPQPEPTPEEFERRYAAGEQLEKAERAAGVTAQCTDCPRHWTLTGRVLQSAVDMHELKHSHVVTIYDTEAVAG